MGDFIKLCITFRKLSLDEDIFLKRGRVSRKKLKAGGRGSVGNPCSTLHWPMVTHTSQPIHNSTLLYPKFPIYNSQLGVPWSHTQVNPFTIPNPTLLYPIAMHWHMAFLWKTTLFNINLHTLYTAFGRIPTGPPQSHTQVNPVTIPKKLNPTLLFLKRTFS